MSTGGNQVVRIASDIPLTNTYEGTVEIDYVPDWSLAAVPGVLRRLRRADAIVLHLPTKYRASIALLATLSTRRPRLVYYDVNIPLVSGAWDRLKRWLYLSLVRRADVVCTLQSDVAEYARLLRLPEHRLRYVGFKSNAWEDAESVARGCHTQDVGSYVLACGRSYRDFATFAAAMAEAGVPAKILLSQGNVLKEGAMMPTAIPGNLEIVPHDGRRASWVEAMLGARIIVVPIRAGVHQPAGISVYLEAMSLSRPVVVTEGASTRGMLDDSIAGIVPSEDPSALAHEVRRLWKDNQLRRERITAARKYVAGLGGVDRMSSAIVEATLNLLQPEFATSPLASVATGRPGVEHS
jgi:glycosyltransferase involved in cell wall biosynthesis